MGVTLTLLSSTISFTASSDLDGTEVVCTDAGQTEVESYPSTIIGPPTAPDITMVNFTIPREEFVIKWDGTAVVSDSDVTGFQVDSPSGITCDDTSSNPSAMESRCTWDESAVSQTHSICVSAINCGSQQGAGGCVSVNLQVPEAPTLTVCPVYDQSGPLLRIESSCTTVSAVDIATGVDGSPDAYTFRYNDGDDSVIPSGQCTGGACTDEFTPDPAVSQYNVSVTARNVVGEGPPDTAGPFTPNVDALPADCLGVLGSLSCDDAADGMCYTASYAVQPDDSVTFTISARTPANTWVGLGVSDDQFMTNSDIVLGAADGTNSVIHDRFAFEQAEPPVDDSQDIESASAEHVDGVTTITFNRPRNSGDSDDTSLDECRFFLFAYGGRVNFFATPPAAIYHGPGPTRRAASLERICIPTFTECSAGPITAAINNILEVVITINTRTVQCRFLGGFTGTAVCQIEYSTQEDLSGSVVDTGSSSSGDTVAETLTATLERSSTYYYLVTATSEGVCAKVEGFFKTDCLFSDLVQGMDVQLVMEGCDSRFVGGVMTAAGTGRVCYNGTATGSVAVYACNCPSQYRLVGTGTRTCLSDGTWSGTVPLCLPECASIPDPPLSGGNDPTVACSSTSSLIAAEYGCSTTHFSTPICGTCQWPEAPTCPAGLSVGAAVGIAVVLTFLVSFSAGLLVALVIAYCYIRRQKSQYSPRDSQQPTPTQASISLQQGNIELKDNISYGPVPSQPPAPQQPVPMYEEVATHVQPGSMEMKANVAYGPISH